MTDLTISLAGHPIGISLIHEAYAPLFASFLTDEPVQNRVCVSEETLRERADFYPPESSPAYVEGCELAAKVSYALMQYDCCIFHSVAFLWQGKAWLFAAPSGTGKTTQYLLWKRMLGEKVTMLNGDKPVLACCEGTVWVHPSPWFGKEGMHNDDSAPLGGIIFLAQAQKNEISMLTPREAVIPLLSQILYDGTKDDAILCGCKIGESILKSVPIWHLKNRGDAASAKLTYETIARYEEAHS